MKPFLPSGHAFVCLDSVESAQACIEYFRAGAKEYCSYVAHFCKDKCCCNTGESRQRAKSTFTKFDDLTENSLEDVYKDSFLVVSRATDASEILWKNMKGDRGLFIIRRMFLFMIGLVVIVFGTTPAVIASNIDFLHLMELTEFSNLVSHYLSPLAVILVNQLLLVMIDWSSLLECYETHNLY